MTDKTEASGTDASKELEKVLIDLMSEVQTEMPPKLWFLVRRTLEMTKEEIWTDEDARLVLLVWWRSGTHTAAHLAELLDKPTIELNASLSGQPVEEARAEVKEAYKKALEDSQAA